MLRLAALLGLLAFAWCGNAHAQENRYDEICADRPAVDRDTLYFCGRLDGEFVKFLSANVSPEIRTLTVTSYGGQFHAARNALEIIEAKGLRIVVEGVCASACAQFLFIPASRGEVLPGAILVMHTSSTSMRAMRLRKDWSEYERLLPLMDAAAQEEMAFYLERGLDPQLLLAPALAMQIACVSEKVDWTEPQWPKVDYFARYLWWAPRKAELERFGMKPKDGFWIETLNDMQVLGNSSKKYRLGNIAIGGNPDFRMKAEKLGKLPRCKTSGNATP